MEIHLRKLLILVAMLAAVAPTVASQQSQSPLDELKRRIEQAAAGNKTGNLSDDKIVAGLREALRVGTGNAVALTGKPDGFLKNAAIKILLPERLRTAGKTLRMVGMGSQVDALEVGMNRAAEQATPKAKQIFLNSLTRMTFSDARQIFSGGDTAATDYFKRTSSGELTTAFAPIVHQAMQNVGVVRQYNQLMKNPMLTAVANDKSFNLDDYVVGKTMDGLFYMVGQEERKIRKDPAAQVTPILKEVFGRMTGGSSQK